TAVRAWAVAAGGLLVAAVADEPFGPGDTAAGDRSVAAGADRDRWAHVLSGRRRARFGRPVVARSTTFGPAGAPAALRSATVCALVATSSAGVHWKMSHSAARTGRDSRSGVVVTRRWTWEGDRSMPRSASSGLNAVVVNMPCSAITSRSSHR